MISCIIMASGFSKRMGRDKLFLPYKNKFLVEHIIEKVTACDFYSTIIIARDDRILNIAEKAGLKAVKNNNAEEGQSEAIKLGIKNSTKTDGYMFFTADQPLLKAETIKLLMETFEKNKENIVVPTALGKRGSPVIFPYKCTDELLKLEGDTGGRRVINNNIKDVLFVDVKDENLLMDVDTWEDYEKIINIKG